MLTWRKAFSQGTFTKTPFSVEYDNNLDAEMKKTALALMILTISLIMTIILFAPIIPVKSTKTQTRIRPLFYNDKLYNETGVPLFINVTNTDSVGGIFSVTMTLSEGKPVPWGVEFEGKNTTTLSLFIGAGSTRRFSSPEDWMLLESTYTFFHSVTPPTTQENYNVTGTEYKSLISIIGNL